MAVEERPIQARGGEKNKGRAWTAGPYPTGHYFVKGIHTQKSSRTAVTFELEAWLVGDGGDLR
jgi:hypothetical protein